MISFSQRTAWNTEESELGAAHRERLAAGLPVADLTASNPTRLGFRYPESWLSPLAEAGALDYEPVAMGALSAREAVCAYYAGHGVQLEPGQVLLTTSTSEAYSYLFKLLCDPGDEVVVPGPSYPLFDFLADAEVVRIKPAALVYDHGWQLEMESLRRAITFRTRAVVIVHPNNPTGHFTSRDQAAELGALCREHGLALVVDEVFLDYWFDGGAQAEARESFAGRELGCPVFVVSGASKVCALPQMKAAWIAVTGRQQAEAVARLEVLADTYLSMNAPVQRGLPVWLREREELQGQVRARVSGNLAEMDAQLAEQELVSRLDVEGGWYAVLRLPAVATGEAISRALLDRGVWVHPGSFFGMDARGWMVVSLLGWPEEFRRGVGIFLEYVAEMAG